VPGNLYPRNKQTQLAIGTLLRSTPLAGKKAAKAVRGVIKSAAAESFFRVPERFTGQTRAL